MSKYHLSKSGRWLTCKATKKACPLNSKHLTDKELLKEQFISETRRNAIAQLIPRKSKISKAYYHATDKKHFSDKNGPGSKFLSPNIKNLNDVVLLAWEQRGSLQGDDREILISLGADPMSFYENTRYLFVETPGAIGIEHSDGLPDSTPIQVIRTKPGSSCSLVITRDTPVPTNHGVIVIGRTDSEEDIVFTAFPGLPTAMTSHEEIESMENTTVSLGRIRKIAGEVWLHTQLNGSLKA